MKLEQNYSVIFSIFRKIINLYFPQFEPKKILVIGCGDGTEAIAIANIMKTSFVEGIDPIAIESKGKNYKTSKFSLDDVPQSNSYGLIYCYHVLEHVDNIARATKKISDLLSKDGLTIIGIPNSRRLVGYVNPIRNITLTKKIAYNLIDLKDRASGFRKSLEENHLGISQKDFYFIVGKQFSKTRSIKKEYYFLKYPRAIFILKIIFFLRLDRFVLPSNYFICEK
jgi:2-polyprenyl-3-methyl-5-hydroxy-6-metoxy-1,4-benzoquinol methylase